MSDHQLQAVHSPSEMPEQQFKTQEKYNNNKLVIKPLQDKEQPHLTSSKDQL